MMLESGSSQTRTVEDATYESDPSSSDEDSDAYETLYEGSYDYYWD